ncbi:MAG: valine--tRNA ligase, partial [Candidatus Omnitrophica bacterium]|nr:valine--tRNA ligase [Candidatus Omnitrophota bacterium]
RYNPKETEEMLYRQWEEKGWFHAGPDSSRAPFTIAIPPPNITGILHMGHALNNSIQDILIRWRRMQGFNALWVPGTDHAGIATQNVVERKVRKEGRTRQGLGRENFIKEVWKWREEHGNTIINQLKRLGASCDWQRTRFTMDKGLSDAVAEAFEQLYNKGLIYRGDYIINWCPRCQTALSDEEAPHVDIEGKLYYIKYPFSHSAERTPHHKGSGQVAQSEGIIVATTRPETMLGDVAVAVNPKDRRYKKLIGRKLILPLVDREIDIIADDSVDKKFGTGAVKITPAHDPNDFEISKRHALEPVKVMAPDGKMNKNAGRFAGMDRFQARETIVRELEEKGLLVKTEKHQHAVGHCYRCHTIVEPYLSLQWFVKMKPLAAPAIEAVKTGKIRFYPKRWTKVYLNWMENIRDWCISRQIWWGHRLPVYYCKACMKQANELIAHSSELTGKNSGIIVSKIRPERCPECGGTDIYQDEDVLDTWFSSWLWPFSTLGWPEKTRDLEYFYPTSVLVTAPEILFFWVARMIVSGLEFMKDIPFKDVYLHGTVRDLTGKKMSKSLGNVIDPIDIINEFGSDALRYSMIAITATGQDVFLSKEKFEIGRNFANKIWNASRFVLMNIKATSLFEVKPRTMAITVRGLTSNMSLTDRWILSRLNRTVEAVTKALENYRFNEAESIAYDFFWHDFCDWYVEMVKPILADPAPQGCGASSAERTPYHCGTGQAADRREIAELVLMHVLENSLKLLHPFMPFVTEAVWQNIKEQQSIMTEKWPEQDKSLVDKGVEKNIELIQGIIISIRNIRSDMNIPYTTMLTAYIVPLKKGGGGKLGEGVEYIKRLVRVEKLVIEKTAEKPAQCATAILEGFNIFVPLEGVIDVEAEKSRLKKKMEDIEIKLKSADKRLKDKAFIAKAPEKVVNMEKEKSASLKEQIERLKKTLKSL